MNTSWRAYPNDSFHRWHSAQLYPCNPATNENKSKNKPSLQVSTFCICIRQEGKQHISGAELLLLAEIYSSTEQLVEVKKSEAL